MLKRINSYSIARIDRIKHIHCMVRTYRSFTTRSRNNSLLLSSVTDPLMPAAQVSEAFLWLAR